MYTLIHTLRTLSFVLIILLPAIVFTTFFSESYFTLTFIMLVTLFNAIMTVLLMFDEV